MTTYGAQPLFPHNAFLSLFRLETHDPGGGFIDGYTFPLSPASVKRTYIAMGNAWDVQASPDDPGTGVTRQVDAYGNAPPCFIIEGTTGYQPHPTDPGVISASILNDMLEAYAESNAAIIAGGGSDLNTMRWLDFYRSDFWQVEPLGEQTFMMDNQRPLLVNYRFRLVGVVDLAGAIPVPVDAIAAAFLANPIGVAANTVQLLNNIADVFNPVTALQVA